MAEDRSEQFSKQFTARGRPIQARTENEPLAILGHLFPQGTGLSRLAVRWIDVPEMLPCVGIFYPKRPGTIHPTYLADA